MLLDCSALGSRPSRESVEAPPPRRCEAAGLTRGTPVRSHQDGRLRTAPCLQGVFGADQRLGVALIDDASEAFERFTFVDVVEAVAALEER